MNTNTDAQIAAFLARKSPHVVPEGKTALRGGRIDTRNTRAETAAIEAAALQAARDRARAALATIIAVAMLGRSAS